VLRSGKFVGHIVGGMKSSTFRSRKATVPRALCAGAPSCRKTTTYPGIFSYGSSFWARRLSG